MNVLTHNCKINNFANTDYKSFEESFTYSWLKNGWNVIYKTNFFENDYKKSSLMKNIDDLIQKISNENSLFDKKRIEQIKIRNHVIFDRFFFASKIENFFGIVCEADIINHKFKVENANTANKEIIFYDSFNPSIVFFKNKNLICEFIDICIEVTSMKKFYDYMICYCRQIKRDLVMVMEHLIISFIFENKKIFDEKTNLFLKKIEFRNDVASECSFYRTKIENNYKLFHINWAASGRFNHEVELVKNFPDVHKRRLELIKYYANK